MYRRHLHIAKSLLHAGIDTKSVDGYGRTALDWARWTETGSITCSTRTPNHTGKPAFAALRQSLKRVSQRLLEGRQKSLSAGFHDLDHCLAFLGDTRSAQFSFRQQPAALKHGDEPMYEGNCQRVACDSDVGFVCSTCPDVILCIPLPGRLVMLWPWFIEIPEPLNEDRRAWAVHNKLEKSVRNG